MISVEVNVSGVPGFSGPVPLIAVVDTTQTVEAYIGHEAVVEQWHLAWEDETPLDEAVEAAIPESEKESIVEKLNLALWADGQEADDWCA